MENIYRLDTTIQDYAWGSKRAIVELLGIPNPGNKPMAELWMGAHPKAPSRISVDGKTVTLDRFIEEHPDRTLGARTVQAFGPRLPFLFKILSAAEPLSIQAHPNLAQAALGFEREERLGIPIDAPERNYRDRNHKPEIICALTPFQALRGFRPMPEIAEEFGSCPEPALAAAACALQPGQAAKEPLKKFFTAIQRLPAERVRALSDWVLSRAAGGRQYDWVSRLCGIWPGDPGVFAPLYLNLVEFHPGQAMFLPAGELHAYLEGTGAELMANSDNVLRGGLTAKHMDLDELLSVLTFEPGRPKILEPERAPLNRSNDAWIETYGCRAREFELSSFVLGDERSAPGRGSGSTGPVCAEVTPRSAEILICVNGAVRLRENGTSDRPAVELSRGASVFVAAGAGSYTIEGRGRLYCAAVGYEDMG